MALSALANKMSILPGIADRFTCFLDLVCYERLRLPILCLFLCE